MLFHRQPWRNETVCKQRLIRNGQTKKELASVIASGKPIIGHVIEVHVTCSDRIYGEFRKSYEINYL